ncbi:SDR family NAD(P)-dependent oxidoreductase [Saccharothrix isguenensis]
MLVNNAGAFIVAPVEDLGVAEFDRTFDVNARAAFVAVKAALVGLTKALARELGPRASR